MTTTTDPLVKTEGNYTLHVTAGGDEYVIDHQEQMKSGILTPEEEAGIKEGRIALNDIICDEPLYEEMVVGDGHGHEVTVRYSLDIADLVERIGEAAHPEDGYIQAEDMVALFPGKPTLHTTTSHYRALLEAGCEPAPGE